jgi:hypothetical protein
VTDWSTEPATAPDVRFTGAVGQGWEAGGTETLGAQTTARWTSGVPGEGLVVTLLTGATAEADLSGWLDAPMALAGLDPQVVPVAGEGAPLTWGEAPGFVAAADVDEQVARSGLLRFTATGADRPELLRSYVLLARRDDLAWKVAVALASAVPPDAPDDVVEVNDHVRARALLADLVLG